MREFCALVEQVYAKPLDRKRPLWQMWVVEGLEGGRVALVTLFHHAYTDGIGAIEMMENVFNEALEHTPRGPAAWEPGPLHRHRAAWHGRCVDLAAVLQKVPLTARAMRERARIEREIARTRPGLSPSPLDRSAAGPFQCRLSRNRRFACETFPVAELRAVAAAFGVTINDVFLACVAGSVRRLLTDAGSALDAPMVATMPLSLKPLDERPTPANYSSMDYVWLHAEIADPIERLRATSASATATKEHFAATKDATSPRSSKSCPGRWYRRWFRQARRQTVDTARSKTSSCRTFPVPGARCTWANGNLIDGSPPVQVAHGAALNFTVWSYGDQFNLCALATPRPSPMLAAHHRLPRVAGRAARDSRTPAEP
jgi:WS/DGAT/MGAT family acyltransferase